MYLITNYFLFKYRAKMERLFDFEVTRYESCIKPLLKAVQKAFKKIQTFSQS